KAIDRLCKTLNCVVRYEEDEKTKKSFIVGLELLPTGKERSGNLPSIVPMMGELSIHARNHQAPEIFGFIQKRLEARFNRLPPVQREQMLESYQRKIDDAKERTAEREKRKQEREDRRAARETRRAQRDEELRLNNPARYELMMQRREEVRMNAQNGN
ncbi:MAG: hypothetical protein KAU21_07765, partial [Gammaproteobacteria bacterium]|nr:hypothetical protein [Gammaproteobacteria bacterium]